MGKKILVTGAGGFIGTALVHSLAQKRGVTVLGVGRRSKPSKVLHYQQLDLLNKEELKALLKKERPDLIFHLAGGRSGGVSQLINDNISTTINVFEAIRQIVHYHPRVMITGSAAEYGQVSGLRRPILENVPAHPAGLYGWVKFLQIQTGLYYAGLGADVIIARLFNILGPGIKEDMAAGKFAREIVRLERSSRSKVLSTSNLEGVRDFLDIRDICEALALLSLKGKKGEVYNICSGKGIVMRDFLNAMIVPSKRTGIKIRENKKSKPGVIYAVGSNVKLRRITGWKAKYNLAQSIQDTLAYYRSIPV